jgi:uncharacterized protein YwqG
VTRKKLRKMLGDAGLGGDKVDAIMKLVRTRVRIRGAKPEGELFLGASRLGGQPDLPAGSKWPKHEDTLLEFVAQLNLADLVPFDKMKELPATGLLSFFVAKYEQIGEERDAEKLASKVFYLEDTSSLKRLPFPKKLEEEARTEPAAVTFRASKQLPDPRFKKFTNLGLTDDENAKYEEVYAEQCGQPPNHQALGYAQANYYEGLPAPGKRLLLQLGSSSRPDFSWGDDGWIFFCIAKDALRERRFDEAYCLMDE